MKAMTITPKLIKSNPLEIISQANLAIEKREIANETTIGSKVLGWILEAREEKEKGNPREEWRRLF